MTTIKDTNDFNTFVSTCKEICSEIYNIRKEYIKGKYDLCAKRIEEIEPLIEKFHDDIGLFSLRNNSIFQLFGDVYSNLEDKERAIKYYQLFHFSSYQIKSPYRNKSVRLLSFRKVSPYSLSDLINNEITLCSPSLMNDPFDSIALLWSSSENSEKLGRGCRKTHEFFTESFKPFKIRSFTKNRIRNKNNILMWSHYADEHRGFCIEYTFAPDFIENRDCKTRTFSIFLDVDYTYDNDDILKSTKMTTQKAFAAKAKCWKYEKEVRLLYYNPNINSDYGYMPLNNSHISAIYFGFRCPEKHIQLIKNMLKDKVKYYKMKQTEGKIYTLEPDKL